ncbi:MAG: metallophosphoesterase family protein [Planctomycetes bacterium]|nr:metallophosphoesterase family protein [Planctomycetota bacterium]
MFAIISDIHGNLEALEAVRADIAEKKVEAVFCLGDVVGYGPDPKACLDRAVEFDFTIMGNHDHAVFMEPTGFNTSAEQAVFWTRKVLDGEPEEKLRRSRLEFLAGMDEFRDRDSILFVHGSPRRPMHEYLFPDEGEANLTRLAESFDLVKHVCLVGHTHLPGVFTETMEFFTPAQVGHKYAVADRKVIINVGSVGQPRDLDPRACYVTVDGRDIRWHRVEYNYKTTMEKILATRELDEFLAARLAEGR